MELCRRRNQTRRHDSVTCSSQAELCCGVRGRPDALQRTLRKTRCRPALLALWLTQNLDMTPQTNFGDLDFKTLGLKLWVSSDGGGAWTEYDLTYQHNRQPPLGPAGQVLALDARVNASAGMHGAWATRERELFLLSSLFLVASCGRCCPEQCTLPCSCAA